MKKFLKILASASLLVCLCVSCSHSGNNSDKDKKAGTGSLIKWRESEALRNADKYAPDSTATNAQ